MFKYWVDKMVKLINMPATKPDNLNSIPELTGSRETANHHKLASDLYMWLVAHISTHTHINTHIK